MELSVNGVTIPAAAIEREAAGLDGVAGADAAAAARRTLAIRELLLQRAGALGLLEDGAPRATVAFASREAEEEVIARVLDAEVTTPEPDDSECRRVYDARPERWTTGELVEARHILFAVTAGTPVAPLRARAEAMLAALLADPAAFAVEARAWSNCPSGETGGNLGQFGRGQMVPEFDRAVFGTTATGVLPELVHSRYGFHIVAIDRRIPGRALPFEAVRDRIAASLTARVQERALRQYVQVLAGRAELAGVDLDAAATPLVQ
jgi:peptidyl-prolyl cis-trans isomerase C